jgi:hypothetical protein
MSTSPRRPFNLLDAMVLLAATAVGLAVARAMARKLWGSTKLNEPYNSEVLQQVTRWTVLCLPFLVAWTIAVLLLQMLSRRPRPGPDDLLCQPGAAACGAAALAITTEAVIVLVMGLMSPKTSSLRENVPQVLVWVLTHHYMCQLGMPGLAVTVAWMALALSGRWQPEPNWLDRTGRSMGLVWVVLMVIRPWLDSMLHR